MRKPEQILDDIFSIHNPQAFNELALEVYRYQYAHVSVYRDFCNHLNHQAPTCWEEIPFIPIELFKSHKIMDETKVNEDIVFKSSGTTGMTRSAHYVADLSVYERSFRSTFNYFFGQPENKVIMGLLPNYVAQGSSSLVYMVNDLITRSRHEESGFYLENYDALTEAINRSRKLGLEVLLFGVSYALLDLAEKQVDLSGVTLVETGGMKGRRKEIIKEELHRILVKGLNVEHITSEYGMTELLSQAYSLKNGHFQSPPWMKIAIRDPEDPFTWVNEGRNGGISVIDLANLHSCSFVHTQDLGKQEKDFFQILGRFDHSDIRGCNLLVNL